MNDDDCGGWRCWLANDAEQGDGKINLGMMSPSSLFHRFLLFPLHSPLTLFLFRWITIRKITTSRHLISTVTQVSTISSIFGVEVSCSSILFISLYDFFYSYQEGILDVIFSVNYLDGSRHCWYSTPITRLPWLARLG